MTKYNDLIPAESSSLTEKPSEVSDSQVTAWGCRRGQGCGAGDAGWMGLGALPGHQPHALPTAMWVQGSVWEKRCWSCIPHSFVA